MDQEAIDRLMMKPEGLLNVRIECGTIRDLLSEMNQRIELLDKRVIEFLKSRELEQLQNQIDQINHRFESFESQGVETAGSPISNNDLINESIDRRIDENKTMMEQFFKNSLQATVNELIKKIEDSINDVRDSENVDNAMKYATMQMFATLQARLEEAEQSLAEAIKSASGKKSRPGSEKHSSRLSSPTERTHSPGKINELHNKVSTLTANYEAIRGQLDDLKKKHGDLENNARNGNIMNQKSQEQIKKLNDSMNLLSNNISRQNSTLDGPIVLPNDENDETNTMTASPKSDVIDSANYFPPTNDSDSKSAKKAEPTNDSYTQPETIIKTKEITVPINVENFKFEVIKSVLDQIMPVIQESLEKAGIQQEKKQVTFSVSDTHGIKESPEIEDSTNDPKDENSPSTINNDKIPNVSTNSAKTRDFSSNLFTHNSPRMNRPDPRMSTTELQIKTLKERVDGLESVLKNKFELFENKLHDLGIRTMSIEKHIESNGQTIVLQTTSESRLESIGCQTFEEQETQAITATNDMTTSPSASRYSTPRTNSPTYNSRETGQSPPTYGENENASPESTQNDTENQSGNLKTDKSRLLPNRSSDGLRPINPNRCLSGRSEKRQPQTVVRITTPKAEGGDAPIPLNSPVPTVGTFSSRSNLSSRSHITSQTYEELDILTSKLDGQVKELMQQMAAATERLGEKDRQIHQMKKSMDENATKDDLDELRSELEERNSFNKKNNPNAEAVTTTQLKRVVANFQNSIKALDKQLGSVKDLVPQFVSKEELTELVDAVTQLALAQNKDNLSSTAGGRLSYKCLLCGRATSQVTGMITETEVARMIGEPPIMGAAAKQGDEFVLVYGKEGNAYRAATPNLSLKKKKTPILPRITPKSPHAAHSGIPSLNSNGA